MAGFVQSYGLKLVDRTGQAFDTQKLTAADVVAFYFSAHWCPPCTHFTPMLKKFVETLQSFGDHSLKIIFVSSDNSEPEMWKYMYEAHGDWLALAYSCRDGKDRLDRQFQVSGIPSLVVIDPVGRQAVRDARGEVMASARTSTQVLTTYLRWKAAAGASGVPAAPSSADVPGELPGGASVRIRGLTGAAEHNGTEGVIKGYDREKGRYVVQLAGGDRSLSLRAANLLQLLDVRVRCGAAGDEVKEEGTGGTSGEWLDGAIQDFDDEAGEIVFTVEGSDEKRRGHLESAGGPGGLVLLQGARVVVHGLQAESAKQWNEQLGKVVEYDEAAGRYVIQVSPSAQLKIKPDNVRLCPLV